MGVRCFQRGLDSEGSLHTLLGGGGTVEGLVGGIGSLGHDFKGCLMALVPAIFSLCFLVIMR